VTVDQDQIGSVILGLSSRNVTEQVKRTTWFAVAINLTVTFLIGLSLFFLSRKFILLPIGRMAQVTRQVAQGDFTKHVAIGADDEIGRLASDLNRLISANRDMLQRVRKAFESLEDVSENLSRVAGDVMSGTRDQGTSVEDVSSTVVQLNAMINGVTGSVETLFASAEEASSSLLEMSASIDQVAQNSVTLSSNVDSSSSSIIEMSASINQVSSSLKAYSDMVRAPPSPSGR